MDKYMLIYAIPYEGDKTIYFPDLEAVAAWLKRNRSHYESLDNVEVVEIAQHVDVYELMKDRA